MTEYFVYIMANKSRMLYIGVTNNLERRVLEHKMKLIKGFTEKFNLDRLVFFENTNNITSAIEREKELKGWVRRKKTALIHSMNPEWKDLSEEWQPPNPDILHYVQDDNTQGDQSWLNRQF